ncbi:hypothetical protein KEM48_004416 [Puccinia striiformis f. sp. tritici PST-130]|nr:hypothetical protein KEM48_004416 [Puccinia striiformis f. sp. tritici PST-130]
MAEMKELMESFISQPKAPHNIPIPETPRNRGTGIRFTTSTPFTGRTPGLDTTIGADRGSFSSSAMQSPEISQFRPKPEIKLLDKQNGVMLDTKKTNLLFDGTEVELFIKRVEKVALLQKAGGQDVAYQLPFIITNRKLSEAVEQMEGHETGDWELLKKELIENGEHIVTQCESLNQDIQDRKVYRYQGAYYYPNRQPIVMDKDSSVKDMVHKFSEENKQSTNNLVDGEKQSTSASVEVEEWGSWVPPQVHMDEDEAENNLAQEAEVQPPQPNQEASKASRQRKSFPGSWLEENEETEESITLPVKPKTPATSLDKVKTVKAQVPGSKDEANKLDKSIRNKFAKQTYTLTLEEILKISPQFLSGLQDSLLEEQALENGLNGIGAIKSEGEVLSFQDTNDRRLCIPICLPSTPGWQKEPPKLRKICALQVDDWETVDIAEETIGGKLLQEIMEDSRRSTQFFEDDAWKMDLIDVESVDWEELRSEPPNDGEVFNQHMALEWGTNSNPEWEAWHAYRADMFIQPQFRQVFSWPRKRKILPVDRLGYTNYLAEV